MRSFRRIALAVALTGGSAAVPAYASWPPDPSLTQSDLAQPVNWPNDPGYAGQWYLWSFVPAQIAANPGFRLPELTLGAGNRVDQAWQITVGDPNVLIAVIDCGIKWDEPDLILKAALNPGELPPPRNALGVALPYDANGDGVFNVADYANDTRIPCGGTTLPHPLRACMAGGTNDDPNHNGVFDAEDLILTFSDGVDGDHNGFVDDVSGWDFFKDDNDPYDDTRYGHGTGEANDSSGEANNGIGNTGVCPRCMFVPLRAGDSFITDVNDFAQAVVYATDLQYGTRTVRVIQEALGTLNNTRFAQQAIDYAYAHDRVMIASAADENSRHHNMPGTNNHVVMAHANTFDGDQLASSTSFLAFNSCTNYGGQMQLSVGAASCSSAAVGYMSGMAGLIVSEGNQVNLTPALSAEEIRQLFIGTVDDINIPESEPGNINYDTFLYPSLPGWDQRFGYGRTNAGLAVRWVRDGRIPPEVDITSPRWFEVMYSDRTATQRVQLEGRIAARRAPSFDYVIEWARGIEPASGTWQTLRAENNVTAALAGTLAQLDVSQLVVDNPGEVENRYTVTFRVRVTAHYGGAIGDVPGESRRVVYVTRTDDLLPGFPVDLVSSIESSPHAYDLDGDGRREIIVVSSDGVVHAIQGSGNELTGFPVHTNLDEGFDPTRTPSYRALPAYAGSPPAIDPDTLFEAVLAAPGIADLDGNGTPEIVVLGYHGTVYVWNHDGTPYGHGFPRRLPDVPSSATSPTRILDRNLFGSPVLYDLNADGTLEIVFGAGDGNLYALDSRTAGDVPGFPVLIHAPGGTEYNRVFGSVGVGHLDGDAIPDIVAVSNERLDDGNTGAAYVVHGDGNRHLGGAYHPNWPVAITSLNLFPLIGSGISSAPPIADVDGDGIDEIGLTGTALPTMFIAHGVQPMHPARPDLSHDLTGTVLGSNQRGPFSNHHGSTNTFINAFSLGSFGDLDGDGAPEFVISGASFDLALNLQGGGKRRPFDHLVGAWNARTGAVMPGYPRVIEDYTFFQNSTMADVSGDDYAEVVIGSGGYYVHATDGCGREAFGFPKFTGQWVIAAPIVADIDGDHGLEVTAATRSGYLYAWHTLGRDTGSVQWPTYRHDPQNTGNYGTQVGYGTRVPAGTTPLVCTAGDAGVSDASVDAGTPSRRLVGGCGCAVPAGVPSSRAWGWSAVGVIALARARRRRR